jgi:hypothetical protein
LLVGGFIESIEEATWLEPIGIVPKKNGYVEGPFLVENLYRFQKNKCSHKEGSIPITFHR